MILSYEIFIWIVFSAIDGYFLLCFGFKNKGCYSWYQSHGLRDSGIHEWWVFELKPSVNCFESNQNVFTKKIYL